MYRLPFELYDRRDIREDVMRQIRLYRWPGGHAACRDSATWPIKRNTKWEGRGEMDARRDRGGKEPPVKLSFPQLSRPISTPPRSSYSCLMFPFRSITCSPSYLFVRPLFRFQVSRTKRRSHGESEIVILCNMRTIFRVCFSCQPQTVFFARWIFF